MCYKGYNHTEESKELNRDKHLGKTSLRKNKTFIFFDGNSKICSKCKDDNIEVLKETIKYISNND